jgi:hypothetical protein
VISLLARISLGIAALAGPVPSAGVEQFTQNCQTSTPRLERLASAIERGDLNDVRAALDEGLDVNETWRDLPAQICRSLLLRAVWHGRDDIFNLLLKRGADPRTVPDDALGIPVRTARIDMVRTLLGLGLKLPNQYEIVFDAIESGNMTMFDLVASSGVTIDATTVPASALSDALTLHLVPTYFRPNDMLPNVGNEACTVQELFGLLSSEQDGCEGTPGPLWLHFVVTGNIRMMELMIEHGADLSLSSEVWDNSTTWPFNAMDVAIRRKDTRMADLLRRAGAPAGILRRVGDGGGAEQARLRVEDDPQRNGLEQLPHRLLGAEVLQELRPRQQVEVLGRDAAADEDAARGDGAQREVAGLGGVGIHEEVHHLDTLRAGAGAGFRRGHHRQVGRVVAVDRHARP